MALNNTLPKKSSDAPGSTVRPTDDEINLEARQWAEEYGTQGENTQPQRQAIFAAGAQWARDVAQLSLREMTSPDLLSKSEAIVHMENGGQVFRTTPSDRFFYKIENGVLMCRCNELGGWHPAIASLQDSDKVRLRNE